MSEPRSNNYLEVKKAVESLELSELKLAKLAIDADNTQKPELYFAIASLTQALNIIKQINFDNPQVYLEVPIVSDMLNLTSWKQYLRHKQINVRLDAEINTFEVISGVIKYSEENRSFARLTVPGFRDYINRDSDNPKALSTMYGLSNYLNRNGDYEDSMSCYICEAMGFLNYCKLPVNYRLADAVEAYNQ